MATQSRYSTNGDGLAPWENEYGARQDDSSLGELLKRLSSDTGDLISQEIALAKAEVKESAANIAKGLTKFLVAWMFGMAGFLALTAFLIVAIGGATGRYGTVALVVGVVEVIVAAVAAKGAMSSMRPDKITPKETIATLNEDKSWAKREITDLKDEITSAPSSHNHSREG
ncbi:MAG TPA: phage holin family protein [Gemmatimonadaceae bacterium]